MEIHNVSYLTAEKVRKIKEDLKYSNLSQTEIARKYGVSQPQISRIKTGQQWSEVTLDN